MEIENNSKTETKAQLDTTQNVANSNSSHLSQEQSNQQMINQAQLLVQLENELAQQAELRKQIGVTALIKKIIDSKRPLIGHHFSLDLLFLFHSFIGELPDTYLECVKKVKQSFFVVGTEYYT